MDIKDYKSLKEALDNFLAPDKEYVLIKHSLGQGEDVKPHYHEKANEWIVADSGKFVVASGEEKQEIDLMDSEGLTKVICLPKGKRHSFVALSDVSYFVVRDQVDDQAFFSVNGH